jgi:hypothetical protein
MRASTSKIPSSVRFSEPTELRLAKLSESSSIPVARLIEIFVKLGLDRVDEAGSLTIPVQQSAALGTEEDARAKTLEAIEAAKRETNPPAAGIVGSKLRELEGKKKAAKSPRPAR